MDREETEGGERKKLKTEDWGEEGQRQIQSTD